MYTEFALVYETLLRLMDELDRVLDGDDVPLEGIVEEIHHRGQGRRLPGTGRTCDENKSLFFIAELTGDRGQAELFHRNDFRRDVPEHGAESTVLHEDVHAKSSNVAQLE
jgi:hypothetical protein